MVHLTAQQPEEHTASCHSNEEAAIEIGPSAGAYPTRSQNPVPSTVQQWNGAAPVVNGQLCLGSREPTPSHLTKNALFASLEVIGVRLQRQHPSYKPIFLCTMLRCISFMSTVLTSSFALQKPSALATPERLCPQDEDFCGVSCVRQQARSGQRQVPANTVFPGFSEQSATTPSRDSWFAAARSPDGRRGVLPSFGSSS
jgi:hypothetical protein